MVKIVLGEIKNQYGEKVPYKMIVIESGKIVLRVLNCYRSAELGLGNCNCESHDPYLDVPISLEKLEEILEEHASSDVKIFL